MLFLTIITLIITYYMLTTDQPKYLSFEAWETIRWLIFSIVVFALLFSPIILIALIKLSS